MHLSGLKKFPITQVFAIAMLAWALVSSQPYAYYEVLRIVVCGVCVYLLVRAVAVNKVGWAWVLGAVAILYNPFIPAQLGRSVWQVVNIATIAMLVITAWTLRERGASNKVID